MANSYSLQMNTNLFVSAACKTNANGNACACHGAANPQACQQWQQFVYVTGQHGIFIQNWLLNYGNDKGAQCPAGWTNFTGANGQAPGCYQNSPTTPVPDQPIGVLDHLVLVGNAAQNGLDTVVLNTETDVYQSSTPDNVHGLAGMWTNVEFNIFGECCGAMATLNPGAQLRVYMSVNDGSGAFYSMQCNQGGFTAETNNMTIVGPCCPEPTGVEFIERTNVGGVGLQCDNSPPVITEVLPSSGPTTGGTVVTVNGSGFFNSTGGAPISFGNQAALNANCPLPTQCTATTPPASAGQASVTFAGSAANPNSVFTYIGPSITAFSPEEGSEDGGTQVEIAGSGLSSNMQAAFGSFFVGMTCASDTHCTVFSPPGKGAVPLTVGGNVMSAPAADRFTYKPFPVGVMGPSKGLPAGGTEVSIGGRNFATAQGATVVNFNMNGTSVPAINVSCSSATECTMTTPALNPPSDGPVVVPVTMTVNGLTNSIGGFTYATPTPPPPPPNSYCQICRENGGNCIKVNGKYICTGQN